MLWFLRALFLTIFATMILVTTRAGLHTPLFDIPQEVTGHPWFVATLVDAYWAFITFYVWVAWKERNAVARVLWFIAIVLLGTIAMSLYVLRELFLATSGDDPSPIMTKRNPGTLALPGALVGMSAVVYAIL